jgi:nucleotide-binding universal stress UspA family protein
MQREPYFRMVVALDLSEYAEIVLEHALDQAARHPAPDIHVVHVVARDNEHHIDEAKRRLGAVVLDALETFDRGPDWRVRLHIRAGKPDEEVIGLAEDVEAQLIVCGRFGVHHARRRLGSVAHRILEHANCPVLAIHVIDRGVEASKQCPTCAAVRAETDGEVWFCAEHSATNRESLAMVDLPAHADFLGGGPMW